MVRLTQARYAETRNKEMQYLSATVNGQPVPYDSDSHIKMNTTISGNQFTVEPFFVDVDHLTPSSKHAPVRPRVVLISGPAIQTGEYTFIIDPDYFGHDPKRQWTGITLCVEADGNDMYKSAVQELNIQIKQ